MEIVIGKAKVRARYRLVEFQHRELERIKSKLNEGMIEFQRQQQLDLGDD